MAREPAESDFVVPVEGIGDFRFGRRTMRDQIKVEVEFARIVDGAKPTAWLATVGGWIAELRVMTVLAPEAWDIENMDPLDPHTYKNLMKVHKALADKEGEFRGRPKQESQAEGEAVG